jgi:hypothetical protein
MQVMKDQQLMEFWPAKTLLTEISKFYSIVNYKFIEYCFLGSAPTSDYMATLRLEGNFITIFSCLLIRLFKFYPEI